ncbi:unnamed protein product [Cylindrotheca closterium]|uniref:Ricin B lectin domain-containing protein n=1 Tax=Cylindrotheca closterium TaxID=2856 RepID=A0AAD2CP96_9STRA|nr:unnamed protein product [Cylindrotheca closterium]
MLEPISAGRLRGQTKDDPAPSSLSSSIWPSARLARNDPNQSTLSSIWSSSRLAQNSGNNQSTTDDSSGESLFGRTLSNFLSYSSPTPKPTKLESSEVNSLPSICLESPDDPVCDKLHWAYYHPEYYTRGKENFPPNEENGPTPSPVSPRTANVPTVRYMATSSPTRDMCYGNMAKFMHGKFCHSEMPSVSSEPSEQPTYFPTSVEGEDSRPVGSASTPVPSESPSAAPSHWPSESPSASPSYWPSESPSASPSIDMDDDVVHFEDPDSEDVAPTPSPTQAPTLSWREFPTHPPASFSNDESEDNGRPNDDNGDYIEPPRDPNAVRLKLYWQQGYYWQEETFERKWCMRCENNLDCQAGEKLFLGDCANNWQTTAYFDLISYRDHEFVQIQVISANGNEKKGRQRRGRNGRSSSSELCVERSAGRHVTLQRCHADAKEEQLWKAPQGSFRDIRKRNNRFELSQSLFGGMNYCLTNHHHPKYGEPLEMYTCNEARRDETSFWNTY